MKKKINIWKVISIILALLLFIYIWKYQDMKNKLVNREYWGKYLCETNCEVLNFYTARRVYKQGLLDMGLNLNNSKDRETNLHNQWIYTDADKIILKLHDTREYQNKKHDLFDYIDTINLLTNHSAVKE